MFVTIWMCTQEWSLISIRATALTFATCHQAFSWVSAFTRSTRVRSLRLPRSGTLIRICATASAGVRRVSRFASAETGCSIRPSVSGSIAMSRTLLACGKLDRERRPAGAGLDGDRPVHAGHELAADVEAEPRAAHAAAHVRVEADELLEDALLLAAGDPGPAIADGERDRGTARLDAELHGCVLRRVLERVLDDVAEHLAQAVGIGEDGRRRRVDGGGESAGGRGALGQLDDLADDRGRVDARELDAEFAGLRTARREDVGDDLREPLRLLLDHPQKRLALDELEPCTLPQRRRSAVDRGQRRTQLVRHRRDEVRFHPLELVLLADVAERVDDPVREGHPRERQPELPRTDLEREGQRAGRPLGPRLGDRDPACDPRPAGKGRLDPAARDLRLVDAGDPPRRAVPEPDAAVRVDEADAVADELERAGGMGARLGLLARERLLGHVVQDDHAVRGGAALADQRRRAHPHEPRRPVGALDGEELAVDRLARRGEPGEGPVLGRVRRPVEVERLEGLVPVLRLDVLERTAP